LDDPFGLFVADLDEFVSKVAALVMLQPSGKAVRVIDRPVFSDDCVVSDLVRHLEPFLLEIRDIGRAVRDLDPG
jgi:hypothetical protein